MDHPVKLSDENWSKLVIIQYNYGTCLIILAEHLNKAKWPLLDLLIDG